MADHQYGNKVNNPSFLRGGKNVDPVTGKSVSPISQPRLSHNTMYTNSTKDLTIKQDESKNFKLSSGGPSFIPSKKGQYESVSPKNSVPNGKPSFL